ncbi:MAG: hypothetical protein IT353_17150 [Gemmatimonadaceae bacterium]|nr:hypothetical protein [Gemmatimonadaceae bacterium]
MMRTVLRRVASSLLLAFVWITASAHVGNPIVVHDGMAGAYGVRVIVRPPGVIPGLVEVIVRSTTPSAVPTSVSVRPALWRVGLKGAPPAEPAQPVPGDAGTFSTRVWIMSTGSYAFHVNASGAQGSGTLVVPVSSVATTASTLPQWLGAVLAALGALLVVGLISIVGATSREAALANGAVAQQHDVRRARKAMALAAVLVVAALTGGWTWWDAVDRDYRRQLDRPLEVATTVTSGDARALTLRITQDDWTFADPKQPTVQKQAGTPLMPDHGKLLHLFLVQAGAQGAVAHLHPLRGDLRTFTTNVPGLPAGTYWLFAEAVRESGLTVSIADTVEVPAGSATPNADGDDAWAIAPAHATNEPARLSDGGAMTIAVMGTPDVARDVTIVARVTNPDGTPAELLPWLGMAGHAIVVRYDGTIFMHVHPMGTASMAAQDRLLRREAGDTIAHGEDQPTSDTPAMSMHEQHAPAGEVRFPVAFPAAGAFRVVVQVRRTSGVIETVAYDLVVPVVNGARAK